MNAPDTDLQSRKPARTDRGWLAVGAATLALGLSFFVPWQPYLVRSVRIDDSWMLALNATFGKGLQCGHDIIFTYGPWGFLNTRCYHPDTFGWMLFAWSAFAVVFWMVCWRVARRYFANPGIAFIWMIVTLGTAALGVHSQNSTLACLPALLLVCYFYLEPKTWSAMWMLLIAAVAWASLVKFSFFIEAVLVVLPIAADQVRRRRLPLVLPLFCIFVVFFDLLAGQRIGFLWDYLRSSTEMAGRYTEAMSIMQTSPPAGWPASLPPPDLIGFLFACGALFGLAVLAERRRRGPAAIWPLAALAGLLFTTYKSGYVRHDAVHAPLATLCLLAVVWLHVPVLRERLTGRGWRWGIGAMTVLAASVCWDAVRFPTAEELPLYFARVNLSAVRGNTASAADLLFGRSPLPADYRLAIAQIREWSPTPGIHGTVDVYPWQQSLPLAYDLDYRPRPAFQSYCAYTPELARLNAEHLQGPAAPQNILFDIGTDDVALRHYPTADDGPSWPVLLARYDVKATVGSFLLLQQSPHPRSLVLEPIGTSRIGFEAKLNVPPPDDGPIWVRIDIQPTTAGRVLSFLYKDPELSMSVATREGRGQRYRLVAGQAETGFLLSPRIDNRREYAALASGGWRDSLRSQAVQSISFQRSGWIGTNSAYRNDIPVYFYRVRIR